MTAPVNVAADHGDLKQRAREIIEQLAALDSSKRPGGGVHGQVIGMEPYIIRTSGDGLQCLFDAQVLLDELLDPFARRPAAQGQALTDDALLDWLEQQHHIHALQWRCGPDSQPVRTTLYDRNRVILAEGPTLRAAIEAYIIGQQPHGSK